MKARDVILFRIGGVDYGMGIQFVQGVETYADIVPISKSQECIEGIVDIRGEVVPIYNLRRKFELPEVPVTEETKFIVARIEGHLVGFKADSVTGMRNISEEDLYDIPFVVKTNKTDYLDFIIKRKNGLAIVIKPEQLLDEAEKGMLKQAASQGKKGNLG